MSEETQQQQGYLKFDEFKEFYEEEVPYGLPFLFFEPEVLVVGEPRMDTQWNRWVVHCTSLGGEITCYSVPLDFLIYLDMEAIG
jgi:hypothetical protein